MTCDSVLNYIMVCLRARCQLTWSPVCGNIENNFGGGTKVQSQDGFLRAFGKNAADVKLVFAELIGRIGNSLIAQVDFTKCVKALKHKP